MIFLKNTLVVILGPTGIGKTDFSIDIAKKLNCEIISADSRQIYKELKIGTAVPDASQLSEIKHHFIGTKFIHDYYSAGKNELEVIALLKKQFESKKYALLVGGSGMYIDAVCGGIDELPDIDNELRKNLCKKYDKDGIKSLRFELKRLDTEYYHKVDLNNSKRILKALEVCYQTGQTYSSFRKKKRKIRDFNILKIGLNCNREELYDRINLRAEKMLEAGLLEEVRSFIDFKKLNALNTVGYKEFFPYFDGEYSLEEAIRLLKRNTRRYAKRQITWYKRDEEINWFDINDKEKIIKFIEK